MSILSGFVSGFQKCHFFHLRQLQMAKLRFKNVTTSPLPAFGQCTAKKQYIALQFCMRVVCMSKKTHSGSVDILNILLY